MMFGPELIIDLYECDASKFNRADITKFLEDLCELIDMVREDLHFWDYVDDPETYDDEPDHMKGTTAIQFIRTSNVTIHTLDTLRFVALNIFSCKNFSRQAAEDFCTTYFSAKSFDSKLISRGINV